MFLKVRVEIETYYFCSSSAQKKEIILNMDWAENEKVFGDKSL